MSGFEMKLQKDQGKLFNHTGRAIDEMNSTRNYHLLMDNCFNAPLIV